MTTIEQRKTRRFELRLPIELVRAGAEPLGRASETRNISSGGVLFSSETQLPVGEPIEYVVTLPTGRETNEVRLHCVGTVIRMAERARKQPAGSLFDVAATLERYEFSRAGR